MRWANVTEQRAEDFLEPNICAQNALLCEPINRIGSKHFEASFFDFFHNLVGISHFSVSQKGNRGCSTDLVSYGKSILFRNTLPAAYTPNGEKLAGDGNGVRRISLSGEAGNKATNITLFRNSKQRGFSDADLRLAKSFEKLSLSVVDRHIETLEPRRVDSTHIEFRNKRILNILQLQKLTPREAEVCAMKIAGYTLVGIGLKLDRSPNTITTHLKRAYSKLGIASQSELFSICFDALLTDTD